MPNLFIECPAVANKEDGIVRLDVQWDPLRREREGDDDEDPILREGRLAKEALDEERERLKKLILTTKQEPDCTHQHGKVGKVLQYGTVMRGYEESGQTNRVFLMIGLCVHCHVADKMKDGEAERLIAAIRPMLEEVITRAVGH